MPDKNVDVVQGTLDMLILNALRPGPMHGWDVLCWLRDISDGALSLEEGAIYPAFYRMEKRGFVESAWGITGNNRRARYYQLTRRGRKELRLRQETWSRYVRLVEHIMAAASPE